MQPVTFSRPEPEPGLKFQSRARTSLAQTLTPDFIFSIREEHIIDIITIQKIDKELVGCGKENLKYCDEIQVNMSEKDTDSFSLIRKCQTNENQIRLVLC